MIKKYSFTRLFISVLIATIGMLMIACNENDNSKKADNRLEKIKEKDILVVGVKKDAPNFALLNHKTNKIEGFEIDMAKMLAKQILGDENKIKLEPVTAKTRGPLLDNGTLDIVIATFTITEDRKKTYNFSEPYYSDPVGFLVLKKNNFNSFKDLNGKVIGVSQGSTTGKIVTEAAKDLGITVQIKEFPDYPSLKSALDSKRIDAFSVDKSILRGYLDVNNKILNDDLKAQEYGIVTRKEDTEWSNYVNNFVKDNKKAIDDLAVKWNLK